jgi:hypothetical protein
MKILESDDTTIPVAQLGAIRADVEAVGALEIASFWLLLPKPPERVEWRGLKLWIASDQGLFAYEATAGWGEPFQTPDGVAQPWRLDGRFVTWNRLSDLAVSLVTAWDEQHGGRRPRRTVAAARMALDVVEPRPDWSPPGSDQAAWQAFVQACVERIGHSTQLAGSPDSLASGG